MNCYFITRKDASDFYKTHDYSFFLYISLEDFLLLFSSISFYSPHFTTREISYHPTANSIPTMKSIRSLFAILISSLVIFTHADETHRPAWSAGFST